MTEKVPYVERKIDNVCADIRGVSMAAYMLAGMGRNHSMTAIDFAEKELRKIMYQVYNRGKKDHEKEEKTI